MSEALVRVMACLSCLVPRSSLAGNEAGVASIRLYEANARTHSPTSAGPR